VNKLKKYLVDIFGFSYNETNSFLIFFSICFISLLISFKAAFFFDLIPERASEINTELDLNSFQRKSEIKKELTQKVFIAKDPNRMNFYDWTSLGLNKKIVNRIISYRLNGGYFNSKKDLLKIYGFNTSFFNEISDKILEPEELYPKKNIVTYKSDGYQKQSKWTSKSHSPKPIAVVDINYCDSLDLIAIKGIGSIRAGRIVKFRNSLGGFYSKNQYDEIFGLDSLSLTNLKKQTTLDTTGISKIEINLIDFKDLLKHPYFNYNLVKVIVNFRAQHGNFKSVQDLLQVKLINRETLEKIQPYLKF
jgi:DNA uptake protein ComE-like DNA-binding protein